MIGRTLASLAATAGLALAPLAGDARMLVVPDCGGGRQMLLVPGGPDDQGDGACAKACHAVTERRGKPPGARKNCC
ncbi:hypothetical protein [Sphingopyxis sp.]|jgi:hypothetical protein|uniref:hypothetical protein n=1 Tax=Sphingopyxis sp. TaxID=1908224 RepID=UPI0025CD9FB8|nr:hypothetical protein [Sphingopyxis sp.]MBK6413829.1 hypothetical protein [Sphingopyxis sp.]